MILQNISINILKLNYNHKGNYMKDFLWIFEMNGKINDSQNIFLDKINFMNFNIIVDLVVLIEMLIKNLLHVYENINFAGYYISTN